MKVEKIKIGDIVPAGYNPRKISESEKLKLKNSIDTFGLVDPIIINLKNNKIIGGHQRYDALVGQSMEDGDFLKELKLIRLGDIGWVFQDTDLTIESEDHEKALNLALNKISGEWDTEKLNDLLEDLEINQFDVQLTGFDEVEITELKLDADAEFWNDVEDDLPSDDELEDEYENLNTAVCPECGHEFTLG